MRKLLAIAALGLISTLCVTYGAGTTANVSWTAPTEYTDGTTLPAADLDHYTISWAPATGQSGPSGSVTVAGNLTSATVPVPCGSTSFSITVTTTATATYPNVTSGPGGPVAYVTGVTCAPVPPGGLAVH